MENPLICSSCKKSITNTRGSSVFNCPHCGKERIIRCSDCRKTVVKYVCHSCGFTGPN